MGPFGYNLFLLKLKTENWKYCSKIIVKCVWIVLYDPFLIFLNAWKVLLQCVNSTSQYVNSNNCLCLKQNA